MAVRVAAPTVISFTSLPASCVLPDLYILKCPPLATRSTLAPATSFCLHCTSRHKYSTAWPLCWVGCRWGDCGNHAWWGVLVGARRQLETSPQ